MSRPGDWKCNSCNYLNFASRRTCRGCGINKPNVPANSVLMFNRSSDWHCPNCNDLQFGRNKTCRMCGTNNPNNPVKKIPTKSKNPKSGPPEGIPKRADDWTCGNCGDYQFARNVKCRSCNTPKNQTENLESSEEEGCVVCMDGPKEASFLHTNNDISTAHTCCCMECAKQIMNTTKKCPMCNIIADSMFRNFQ